VVSKATRFHFRPFGPAPDPLLGRPEAGSGFRAALAALFPVAEGLPTGQALSTRRRAVRVALELAAVCAAAGVLLFRVGGIPSWDLVYAEDNGVFLVGALARPWHLLDQFGGYLEFVPRIIGQAVSFLPLMDAAKGFAVAGAMVAAICALFTFRASAGYIRSPWLRGLLGAGLVLLPLAPIEMADSGVTSPWYLLPTAFWAVMWRPQTRGGMLAAALVAFAATSSEIVAILYVPLLAIRLFALPRVREQAVTVGFVLGLLLQVPAVLGTYSQHGQRLSGYGSQAASVKFYLHTFVARALGWHLSWHLQKLVGLNGATAIVAAFLVAVLAWVLITGDRQVRVFAVLAALVGFVEVVVCASVPGPPGAGWVARQVITWDFLPGSRYDAVPVMLLYATVIIAVDHFIRRRAAAAKEATVTWGLRPWALVAVTALTVGLAFGWVTDYRYHVASRVSAGYWGHTANSWLRACARSHTGEISLSTWDAPNVNVPCARLHR
jgi:hypothetical protein